MKYHRLDRSRRTPAEVLRRGLLTGLALSVLATGCDIRDEAHASQKRSKEDKVVAKMLPAQPTCPPKGVPASAKIEFEVPPPPFTKGIFPCQQCHEDMEPNFKRRVLKDEHTSIKLNHGPRERWCFDCHNPKNRNYLRLASGALVKFSEHYKLCGQCHGPKLRDWKLGVHGRRYGFWTGPRPKKDVRYPSALYGPRCYLLCANCHNPHSPHFKPTKPLPPPHQSKTP